MSCGETVLPTDPGEPCGLNLSEHGPTGLPIPVCQVPQSGNTRPFDWGDSGPYGETSGAKRPHTNRPCAIAAHSALREELVDKDSPGESAGSTDARSPSRHGYERARDDGRRVRRLPERKSGRRRWDVSNAVTGEWPGTT